MHAQHAFQKGKNLMIGKIVFISSSAAFLFLGQTFNLSANPTGGQVAAGSASITDAGKTLTVNQTSHTAIINWQSFSIGAGELTKFVQPSSTSAALNRVISGNPSAIYGTLSSNGQIYLINPNGILVGPGGVVNTAGFIASTRDISNQDFLSGNLHFVGSSDSGVQNLGTINALGGNVYLIGHTVDNQGDINAPNGTAGLAAGDDVLIAQGGTESLFVQPNANSSSTSGSLTGVHNSGTIKATAAELKAANGNMYALAINNSGTIIATTVKHQGGHIYLTSDSGTVVNSGTLDASATAAGGKGGSITVKSTKGTTIQSGKILAKGGQGGAGGNVDISAAKVQLTGMVDTTSPGGTTGMLILDPATWTVAPSGGDETGAQVAATLANTDLTLTGDTLVTIDDSITWTSNNTLTLATTSSSSTIVINAAISGINGGLTLSGASDTVPITATASVNVANFILQHGFWTQDSATLPTFTASHDFEIQNASSFLRITGGDGVTAPFQITDVYGLEGLASPSNNFLGANAELMNDIDATGTATWNAIQGVPQGFVPIGSYDGLSNDLAGYGGTFNGQGFVINGLYINTPSASSAGLFGDTRGGSGSVIENLGLTNANVTGSSYVGALVGVDNADISNCYSTGSVSGTDIVGGLIGIAVADLNSDSSSATVTSPGSSFEMGGLIGYLQGGEINDSYATGAVTVGASSDSVGGLVGINFGNLHDTYSTGAISAGSGSTDIGALIGTDDGTVNNSFWDASTAGVTSATGQGGDPGVIAATTSQLESESFILANSPVTPIWDFSNIWTTNDGTTLPQLIGGTSVSTPPPNNGGGSNTGSGGGTPPDDSGLTLNSNPIILNLPAPSNLNIPPPPLPSLGNNNNGGLLPVNYSGNGSFGQTGQQGGSLANSSGNGGDISSGDAAQLHNGGINNVSNPAASGELNQALGPFVRTALFDALEAEGSADFTDNTPGSNNGHEGHGGGGNDKETILSGGDAAQIGGDKVENIPWNKIPKQLQDAMGKGVLKNLPTSSGTGH
jgi:filamentous hemagglutinin family protein